ncbi:MAG: hypothetical protein DRQ78_05005 [Epsilonproteobacteria bacterium]|nr:MAG: hypothetical protein DRQ78_05005 [Campylobacterota bacterium]
MANGTTRATQHSIGGVSTHILLEFSREAGDRPLLYLGSVMSLSYSVYRDKTPVFNCGSHLIDGFSIANKYVAGSLITVMYEYDEFAGFMDQIEIDQRARNEQITVASYQNAVGIKEFHTYMRDDLIPFNIHAIFTNEYTGSTREIVIYDATFINNGQVMSIQDLITENTLQYVARDISEQHAVGEVHQNYAYSNARRASDIVLGT